MTELTEELKQQYQNYDQAELDDAFTDACKNGDLAVVQYVLTSPDLTVHVDVRAEGDEGFIWACIYGNLNIVKYLLTSPELQQHVNIHAGNDEGFQSACRYGHLDVVKYLLTSPDLKEHADIHADEDLAFQWACEKNSQDSIILLLSFNGEKCINFQRTKYGLDWAIYNRYNDIVIAMMRNLFFNDFVEYLECLPTIETYNKELYGQVKNIENENLEVNPTSETLLFV